MNYMKVLCTLGYEGEGYMEIAQGVCQRVTDIEGNTIEPLEYHVIDDNPEFPSWGNPELPPQYLEIIQ